MTSRTRIFLGSVLGALFITVLGVVWSEKLSFVSRTQALAIGFRVQLPAQGFESAVNERELRSVFEEIGAILRRADVRSDLGFFWLFEDPQEFERLFPVYAPELAERLSARVRSGVDKILVAPPERNGWEALMPYEIKAFLDRPHFLLSEASQSRCGVLAREGAESTVALFPHLPRQIFWESPLESAHFVPAQGELSQGASLTNLIYSLNTVFEEDAVLERLEEIAQSGSQRLNLLLPFNEQGVRFFYKLLRTPGFVLLSQAGEFESRQLVTGAQGQVHASHSTVGDLLAPLFSSELMVWTQIERRRWLREYLFSNQKDHSHFRTESEDGFGVLRLLDQSLSRRGVERSRLEDQAQKRMQSWYSDYAALKEILRPEENLSRRDSRASSRWTLSRFPQRSAVFEEPFVGGAGAAEFFLSYQTDSSRQESRDFPMVTLKETPSGVVLGEGQEQIARAVLGGEHKEMNSKFYHPKSVRNLKQKKVIQESAGLVEASWTQVDGDPRVFLRLSVGVPQEFPMKDQESRVFLPLSLVWEAPFLEEDKVSVAWDTLGGESHRVEIASSSLYRDSLAPVAASYVSVRGKQRGLLISRNRVVTGVPRFMRFFVDSKTKKLVFEFFPLEIESFRGERADFFLAFEFFEGERPSPEALLRAQEFSLPGFQARQLHESLFSYGPLERPFDLSATEMMGKGVFLNWRYPASQLRCFHGEIQRVGDGASITFRVEHQRQAWIPEVRLIERFSSDWRQQEFSVRLAATDCQQAVGPVYRSKPIFFKP